MTGHAPTAWLDPALLFCAEYQDLSAETQNPYSIDRLSELLSFESLFAEVSEIPGDHVRTQVRQAMIGKRTKKLFCAGNTPRSKGGLLT